MEEVVVRSSVSTTDTNLGAAPAGRYGQRQAAGGVVEGDHGLRSSRENHTSPLRSVR